MHQGRPRSRWLVAAAVGVTVVLGAGLAACTTEPVNSASGTEQQAGVEPAAATTPPKVTIAPRAGKRDVSPSQPINVQVANGTIADLKLTNPDGKQVKGKMSADRRSWKVTEPLGYSKVYTWSGNATGANGKQTKINGRFRTATPSYEIGGTLNVDDNQTYGVAMPIAIKFDSPVSNKAAVERRLKVETSNQAEGSWSWLDDYAVHWRPKEYWEPNTNVKVSARLYGAPMGDGAFGTEDLGAQFKIGEDRRVRADVKSHHIALFKNGKKVARMPASFGLDSDPGRVTRGGTHVVMSKHSEYYMTNPAYDYENVYVEYAVRVSNNGEFIHAYPSSEYAQGNSNVSHGCVNLSTENGQRYFNFAQIGDPVEVVNSTVPLDATDGDYHDWTINWKTWKSNSAL